MIWKLIIKLEFIHVELLTEIWCCGHVLMISTAVQHICQSHPWDPPLRSESPSSLQEQGFSPAAVKAVLLSPRLEKLPWAALFCGGSHQEAKQCYEMLIN